LTNAASRSIIITCSARALSPISTGEGNGEKMHGDVEQKENGARLQRQVRVEGVTGCGGATRTTVVGPGEKCHIVKRIMQHTMRRTNTHKGSA
jgi:hypothetical protein